MIKDFIAWITATKACPEDLKTPLVNHPPSHQKAVDADIIIDHLKKNRLPGLRCKGINILHSGGFNISGSGTGHAIGYFLPNGNGERIGGWNIPDFKGICAHSRILIISNSESINSAVIQVFITRITATKAGTKDFKTPLVNYLPMHLATVDVEIKIYHLKINSLPNLSGKRIDIPDSGGFNISSSLSRHTVCDLIADGNFEPITDKV